MDVREYRCVEDAKKAERAAERKAMKAARAKAEKALLKAILLDWEDPLPSGQKLLCG
jgi:hypothetical protein